MKFWKKNLVPILFALGGVFSLVPVMKSLIKGEPLNETFLVLAINYFVLAVVFLAVGRGRKSGEGTGPASADQGTFRDKR